MNIDWANFTPFVSLTGGIILGLASAVFILVNGRILGISGIVGGLFPPKMGHLLAHFIPVGFCGSTHGFSRCGASPVHHCAAH